MSPETILGMDAPTYAALEAEVGDFWTIERELLAFIAERLDLLTIMFHNANAKKGKRAKREVVRIPRPYDGHTSGQGKEAVGFREYLSMMP